MARVFRNRGKNYFHLKGDIEQHYYSLNQESTQAPT